MKKVFDWTIGSFFRTIGKTLAILFIGTAIAFILSSNDIRLKLPSIISMKVNASTFTTDVVRNGQTTVEYTSSNTLTQQSNYYVTSLTSSTSINSVQYVDFNVVSNNAQDGDLVEIPFIYSMPVSRDLTTTNTVSQRRCTKWKATTINVTPYQYVEEYSCTQYSTLESDIETYETFDYTINNSSFGFYVWTGTNYTTCQINEDMIQCPVLGTGSIQRIRVYYNVRTNIQTNFTFGLGNRWLYYKSTGSTINSSIQNQTQQQQQQHQEMMDSNTTQAEDDAEGFFDDFEVPDVGGLSAIVTAPLNTIRSLLNSSCSPLVLPLPYVNSNLTLPCMNSIYTNHFGAFFVLYQTIMLGIIAYRCIRSIFFDIKGFTNPDDDRIEVIDL